MKPHVALLVGLLFVSANAVAEEKNTKRGEAEEKAFAALSEFADVVFSEDETNPRHPIIDVYFHSGKMINAARTTRPITWDARP